MVFSRNALTAGRYEMVNPGQDGDVETDPTKNLMHVLARVNSDRRVEIEELKAVRSAGTWGNDSEVCIPSVKVSKLSVLIRFGIDSNRGRSASGS